MLLVLLGVMVSVSHKLTISPSTFKKVLQRCRNVMDLVLNNNTKQCSVQEWKYFTLMSIFSSLTGMLSLLSLYLYFKIREKIKKKKSLEKETRVLRQAQGTSAWAAACIGGRRRADFVLQEPMIHQTKGKKKWKEDCVNWWLRL